MPGLFFGSSSGKDQEQVAAAVKRQEQGRQLTTLA
jgi:hypothetical protein